ncbi:MAG: tail fiber domain-containing protein [Verrucomicrobia bacterium]|nr:tail fiber domain-containing protein [Verrucomicrobiota bacterium]
MKLLPITSALLLSALTAGPLSAEVPPILNYQGRVAVGGANFEGTGQFKFALVDGSGTATYWSNDGSSFGGAEPAAAVPLPVSKGLYSIVLGDTALANMTAVPAVAFTRPDVRLRVWFNDGVNGFQLLTPDQPVAAVGYAMNSAGLELPATDATGRSGVIRQNGGSLLHTFGTANAFGGKHAGNFTLTGQQNTGFGESALGSLTSGSQNTGFGINSLVSTTTGYANTSVGWNALIFNVTGSGNTAVGSSALYYSNSGLGNTAVGGEALMALQTGDGNISLGNGAGAGLVNGSSNIYIGNRGQEVESGVIRIGSGQAHTYLSGIIHGNGSGLTGLTGSNFSSDLTLAGITSGTFNGSLNGQAASATNFTGPLAGDVGGSQNATVVTSVGGVSAAAVASGVGLANAASSGNTANALVRRDANGSFSAGSVDLSGLSLPTTSSSAGAIRQNGAALLHTYGSGNFYAGVGAGNFTHTGNTNVGVGTEALSSLTTGRGNTGVGHSALQVNTTGIYNTAVGGEAAAGTTTGSGNTAIGLNALHANATGGNNVAVGDFALNLASNSGNVAIGSVAAGNLTTGSGNIVLGAFAGNNFTTESNNIVIANAGVSGDSGVIRLGTGGTHTRAFLAGVSGVTSSGGAAVFVDASGQLGTVTSSRRFKDDIRDMGEASEALLALRPVTFRYKPELDPAGLPQAGLIAEEVAEVNAALVVRDAQGVIQTVRYEQVNAMLLNEFLKDHRRLAAQAAELRALQAQHAALQQQLAAREAAEQAREARLARLEKLLLRSSGVQAVALQSAAAER